MDQIIEGIPIRGARKPLRVYVKYIWNNLFQYTMPKLK